MTGDERRAMRALLSDALTRAILPGATPDPPGALPPTATAADLVPRFVRELTAVGGQVHEPTVDDAASVAQIIAGLATGTATKRALLWDDACLPVVGLAAALASLGFEIARQHPDEVASAESRARLALVDIGITGADAALAETGSIVLASGPGRGRLVSLLPPVHVALVRRTSMIWSLPDLLATRPDLAVAGSNLVCITGPSRTADIEHTLSRGVHGPREVHVVLVG